MNYTPLYSAIVKVARMFVALDAYHEREAELERIIPVIRAEASECVMTESEIEAEAQRRTPSMFQLVRSQVRRYMVRVGGADDQRPTPMDWIYDTRTYGMTIRNATPAEGTIMWKGDTVTHKRTTTSVSRIAEALH